MLEYNSIINSTSQQLAPSLIQIKVKQRGTKDPKWITRCSKEGNSIWFFGGFYGHDQRKDSDKIIKHIDYQAYIHLINIIK